MTLRLAFDVSREHYSALSTPSYSGPPFRPSFRVSHPESRWKRRIVSIKGHAKTLCVSSLRLRLCHFSKNLGFWGRAHGRERVCTPYNNSGLKGSTRLSVGLHRFILGITQASRIKKGRRELAQISGLQDGRSEANTPPFGQTFSRAAHCNPTHETNITDITETFSGKQSLFSTV